MPLPELTPTALSLPLLATVWFHSDTELSSLAASRKADMRLCSWPIADSLVSSVDFDCCSSVSGRALMAISWVTMPLTSRPLPMPVDEMVAMALPLISEDGGTYGVSADQGPT